MNKVKNSIEYDWIYYLIGAVFSIIFWILMFRIYHEPKNNEKIMIFYAGEIKDYKLEKDGLNDGIKRIELSSINPSMKTFKQKYELVGLNNSDIVIVPISIANDTACSLTFKELTSFSAHSMYTQESKNYGIVLNDSDKERLSLYFEFTSEEYVILIKDNNKEIVVDFIKWLINEV